MVFNNNAAPVVWFHCSSLGEFEQGRPVTEAVRQRYPAHKILLTFFSPSGFEVQKNYKGADYIFYLPIDSAKNSKLFIEIIKPALVVFIKYDYWYHYLKTIHEKEIPCLLISATFRKEQPFFKWYGGFYRQMLRFFTHIFVQNEEAKKLLETIEADDNCSVAGDTRFDRVIEIAEKFEPIPVVEAFSADSKIIVAGSTWKDDEEALQKALKKINNPLLKLILAPHEINTAHIEELQLLFPGSVLFSDLIKNQLPLAGNVLIINNVGLLSRLYHYAYIAYVGGGFTQDGVHNVLEAAVYGRPVIFGPNYEKYREAKDLISQRGGVSIKDDDELTQQMISLLNNEEYFSSAASASLKYVRENSGATEKIADYIQKNLLLTN